MRVSRGISDKLTKSEKGAAAVEFALILPLLVLLVFGIIEFGRVYNIYLTVTHAAREGARIASVRNGTGATDEEIKQIVDDRSPIYITSSNVEINPGPDFKTPGQPIDVGVHYTATINIPLFGAYPVHLVSTGTMRIE